MLYNNADELLNILKREHLYTEKHFGQNFLINTEIIETILSAAALSNTDHVLEIGPGLGILTAELIQRAQEVTAIEKDDKLIPFLKRQFSKATNLTIIHADILQTPCPPAPYKVVANIPYYITSPILTHFLKAPAGMKPEQMVLMTQLEVAQKICSDTGGHSILSLHTQLFAEPTLIRKVNSDNFFPAPEVDSAIISLRILEKPRLKEVDQFLKITKQAFQQKRKTLANTLQGFHKLKKIQWEAILQDLKLDPMIRPQHLSFENWTTLLEKMNHDYPV